jgi:hypothetical protein
MIKPVLTSLTLLLLYSCKGPSSPKTSPPSDTAATKAAANPITPNTTPDTIALMARIDTPAKPMIAKNWKGAWKDVDKFSEGQLHITTVKGNKLSFSIYVEDGGASGLLEGTAKLDGYRAHYIRKEYGGACRIDFTYEGDHVYVRQLEGSCGAGAGVYYDGSYYANPKEQKEETLVTLGVLSTGAQDKKFRQMVGNDYHLFVNSSQLVGNGIDLDSLHAIVHDSWVKHELTSKRNIVLINDRLDIWAAVIDEDSIKYYTTREDYRHKLPKTIDDWQKDLEDKKLIFK